jgi:hypothetical protein
MPSPYPGAVHAAHAGQSKTLCALSTAGLTVIRPGAVGVTCTACRAAMRKAARP